jgi:hypothetical protein
MDYKILDAAIAKHKIDYTKKKPLLPIRNNLNVNCLQCGNRVLHAQPSNVQVCTRTCFTIRYRQSDVDLYPTLRDYP